MQTENSGSFCDYYQIPVTNPQHPAQKEAYVANTEDLIQALGMTFDEGCEFKSLVRRANARLGFVKAETTAVRDAAKGLHYAKRIYAYELEKAGALDVEQETQVAAYACSMCLDTQKVDNGKSGTAECPYCKTTHRRPQYAVGCSLCHGKGTVLVGMRERLCTVCTP